MRTNAGIDIRHDVYLTINEPIEAFNIYCPITRHST